MAELHTQHTTRQFAETVAAARPTELLASYIAAIAAIDALGELLRRGVTPDNLEALRSEIRDGLATIRLSASLKGVALPTIEKTDRSGDGS